MHIVNLQETNLIWSISPKPLTTVAVLARILVVLSDRNWVPTGTSHKRNLSAHRIMRPRHGWIWRPQMMSPVSVALHLLALPSYELASFSRSLSLCGGPWQLQAYVTVTNSIWKNLHYKLELTCFWIWKYLNHKQLSYNNKIENVISEDLVSI